ncbi:MAG TPA: hypothetical protein VJ302_09445 [Blastocatellia bacterium]|nr:hypothetical protein [Blastocatellia bacterium]
MIRPAFAGRGLTIALAYRAMKGNRAITTDKKRYLGCLFLALLIFASCRLPTLTPATVKTAVATATLVDGSESFRYLDEALQGVTGLAKTLQPDDSLWLGAISANSAQLIDPVYFRPFRAETIDEIKAYLEKRRRLQSEIDHWFTKVKESKQSSSDVCSAMHSAIYALHQAPATRKLLLVYSDFNDNVTRECNFSLTGIEVRLLYVYPADRNPRKYREYAAHVKELIEVGHPASLEVLFPVQAKTFDPEKFISVLRGE